MVVTVEILRCVCFFDVGSALKLTWGKKNCFVFWGGVGLCGVVVAAVGMKRISVEGARKGRGNSREK